MTPLRRAALVALLACAPAGTMQAQHEHGVVQRVIPAGADSLVVDFTRRARAGVARYEDQAVAVSDGYRRLGPDFPAMGEHWVNAELVARGVLDPARPPLLTYVRSGPVARLTGVVYALPLADGELPPTSPFAREAWHDHFGSVEDESLLLDHDAQRAPAGELRLAVLHAWLFVENPAGTFVTDNWALPYARLGVPVPPAAPMAATRALSLLGGSLPYYRALAERAVTAHADAGNRLDAVLAHHREVIRVWWSHRASVAALRSDELVQLAEMWRACWADVARGLPPEICARLRAIEGT